MLNAQLAGAMQRLRCRDSCQHSVCYTKSQSSVKPLSHGLIRPSWQLSRLSPLANTTAGLTLSTTSISRQAHPAATTPSTIPFHASSAPTAPPTRFTSTIATSLPHSPGTLTTVKSNIATSISMVTSSTVSSGGNTVPNASATVPNHGPI